MTITSSSVDGRASRIAQRLPGDLPGLHAQPFDVALVTLALADPGLARRERRDSSAPLGTSSSWSRRLHRPRRLPLFPALSVPACSSLERWRRRRQLCVRRLPSGFRWCSATVVVLNCRDPAPSSGPGPRFHSTRSSPSVEHEIGQAWIGTVARWSSSAGAEGKRLRRHYHCRLDQRCVGSAIVRSFEIAQIFEHCRESQRSGSPCKARKSSAVVPINEISSPRPPVTTWHCAMTPFCACAASMPRQALTQRDVELWRRCARDGRGRRNAAGDGLAAIGRRALGQLGGGPPSSVTHPEWSVERAVPLNPPAAPAETLSP